MTVYLGAGSNIDPETNLTGGLKLLLSRNIRVSSVSTHFMTEPLKERKQPRYINGIWKITDYEGSFSGLKAVLDEVEKECGRIRTDDSYASRTLDLDIILTDIYASDEILSRDFLYIPLLEMDREISLPGYGKLKERVDEDRRKLMLPLKEFTETLRRFISE